MSNAGTSAALTVAHKIHRIAVEVMGWKIGGRIKGKMQSFILPDGSDIYYPEEWNPLTDWNHFRKLEEKMMEDKKLWSAFCMSQIFRAYDEDGEAMEVLPFYMKAALTQRVDALLQALSSYS